MSDEMETGARPVFRSNREIAIHVHDPAVAEAFYGGVLGFPVVERRDEYVAFDTGAIRLYVIPNPTTERTYIPSFEVESFETARRHLERAGCQALAANADGTGVYFRDPFGFVFDVVERAGTGTAGREPGTV